MPTQQHLQEIAENLDKWKIGLDDVFKFKCHGCGKCCKNREDIILTSRDLFNVAKCLDISTKDVIKTYCDLYIGGNSRMPIVRLIPRGQNKACPLLKDNRCSVHRAKPGVCALFPLGRIIAMPQDKEVDESTELEVGYIINPIECGGHRNNTVRSWLEAFGIDTDDQVYKLWTKTTFRLTTFIKRLEESKVRIPAAAFSAIWTVAAEMLYIRYDTEKEFFPQFKANTNEVWRILGKMDSELLQPFMEGVLSDAI